MKLTLLLPWLILSLANLAWSQGRDAPLAKEAYGAFAHYGEGYYRAYLVELRKSQLLLPDGNSVSVLGQVSAPGEVLHGAGITASKAIADVGGIPRFADRRHVGIWKNRDGQFIIFNLKALEEKEPGALDPVLEGGDIVIVLQQRIGF